MPGFDEWLTDDSHQITKNHITRQLNLMKWRKKGKHLGLKVPIHKKRPLN
ncbi:hypothetical protein [Companilactobacillus versmoldensis]|nr:hypothetical protein [Companilactobacillus versmoldensis]